MTARSAHIACTFLVICVNTLVFHVTYAAVWRNENQLRAASATAPAPISPLASRVIYESQPPSLANVYKEFLVSSKPLSLRKYGANGQKTKKTKKDSKIYFIAIPALPYRFIPGVGYDYQPMKINPILKEKPQHVDANEHNSPIPQYQTKPSFTIPAGAEDHQKMTTTTTTTTTTSTPSPLSQTEGQIYQLNRGDYFFNGRPYRLRVAHAQRKHHLTPQNLKANFYYDKNIIY